MVIAYGLQVCTSLVQIQVAQGLLDGDLRAFTIRIILLLLTWLAGRTPASYLFPLVQGGIVVGVTLCSVLFFKEKLSRRSCFGLALGVCAIAVINL